LKKAGRETSVKIGDSGSWCVHGRINVLGGYAADSSHPDGARGRSRERDDPACARQGYHETAVVLDADGTTIIALRGGGAGIHTLDSAHDKAYASVSFKNDTLALAERAKGEDSIAPSPSFHMSCSSAVAL
jgi:Haem-degrading